MTRAKVEQPTAHPNTTSGRREEVKYTHPAYACIKASRTNGSMNLFDSKVPSEGFVVISVHEANLNVGPYSDHIFGHGKRIIEIGMAEHQWVALISRMNIGMGTPCTLMARQTGPVEQVPSLPPQENPAERLRRGAEQISAHAIAEQAKHLAELTVIIETLPKGKQANAKMLLDFVCNRAQQSMKYGEETLTEHAEKLVVHATQEIDSKVKGMLTQLGIEKLQDLIALDGPRKNDVFQGIDHDE